MFQWYWFLHKRKMARQYREAAAMCSGKDSTNTRTYKICGLDKGARPVSGMTNSLTGLVELLTGWYDWDESWAKIV